MEDWKDIPGYEGIYEASTLGQIRTHRNKVTYTVKHGTRHWKQRILKPKSNGKMGYRVNLWKDGKMTEWLVARLVCMTFHGLPKEGHTVNHINGDRWDNHIENLEWLSLADNIRHGFETGLYTSQKPVKFISLNDREDMEFKSQAEAARFLNKSNQYISDRINTKKNRICADADGKQYLILPN
jgi:hypothetical protein